MKFIAPIFVVLALAACAVQPPPALPPSHPASPAATEAPTRPIATDLAADEPTRTTEQLLAPSSGVTQ